MNINNYKILSFFIAFKRYKKNSVVFKAPVYRLSQKFNISPVTFQKYLSTCMDLGVIVDHGTHYSAEKFKTALVKILENTDLFFGNHSILSDNSTDVKKISRKIQGLFVVDNIISPQQRSINKKQSELQLVRFSNRTEKSDSFLTRPELKKLKKLSREGKLSASYENTLNNSLNTSVTTSARHTATKLGVSLRKANLILNDKENSFDRSIFVKWIKGISIFKIDSLRIQYPQATVIPMLNYNCIKICFGSELRLK